MKKSLLLLGFVAALAAQAETVVIEAEWFEDYGGFDSEHHGITLKLVSHGGIPSSEPQTVTANADVVLT